MMTRYIPFFHGNALLQASFHLDMQILDSHIHDVEEILQGQQAKSV